VSSVPPVASNTFVNFTISHPAVPNISRAPVSALYTKVPLAVPTPALRPAVVVLPMLSEVGVIILFPTVTLDVAVNIPVTTAPEVLA
jgi:hypothetical protein